MTESATSGESIVATLGQHLARDILGSGETIDPEQNLLLEGGVDSLGMLKLVAFIELTYDVKVPPSDFTIENFRSLSVIGGYVGKLLS